MKRKKKSLFAILLALVMMAGLMQGMTIETKAAANLVQAGPFTLSRDSKAIVEGVDYTYGKYEYGNWNTLTILTDDITIAMDEMRNLHQMLLSWDNIIARLLTVFLR